MAKTKQELDELKQEYESLKAKLQELNEDELKQVSGGQGETDGSIIKIKDQQFRSIPTINPDNLGDGTN